MTAVPYVDLAARYAPLRGALLEAFARVLAHGQFVLGPEVEALEARLAERLGAAHVVTCGSGTGALELALRLRGVGPGDEVITVSHSFVATASAIALTGARSVLVDVADETMTMDPDAAEAAITPRTRAVIPVHLNGYPMDLSALAELCERHGLALIEDCAQSLGARREGRATGTLGLGCHSLHPLKPLAGCGDAGFVTAAEESDARRLRELRNLGLESRDVCARVGPNCRLDTLQAAALLVMLDHLDDWLDARRAHAAAYRRGLCGRVRLPPGGPGIEPSWSAFVVRHPERERLRAALAAAGVDAKVHYPLPIHRQPAFAGAARGPLPVTERVVDEILSLPVGPELSEAGRGLVIDALREACAPAGACA